MSEKDNPDKLIYMTFVPVGALLGAVVGFKIGGLGGAILGAIICGLVGGVVGGVVFALFDAVKFEIEGLGKEHFIALVATTGIIAVLFLIYVSWGVGR